LTLLHKTLLLKRDGAYKVSDLREKLNAPPYGIPSCNLAILAAVAIRHEIKRLHWGSNSDSDFSVNLANAFLAESKLSIRLFEFSSKQLALLHEVGFILKTPRQPNQSPHELSNEAAKSLREFVKNQPDSVKRSSQLQSETKDLVKFLQSVPTKNSQDLADYLLNLLGLENKSSPEITNLSPSLLKNLLDDFDRIINAKEFLIKQTWQTSYPKTIPEKTELLDRLTHENSTHQAKKLAFLIEHYKDPATVKVDELSGLILNKPCIDCNDVEIGQCQGKLEALFSYHPPLSLPLLITPPQLLPSQIAEPQIVEPKQNLITTLRQQIKVSNLSSEEIKQVLQQLLHDYTEF
jgi:hypothetical protein